MYEAHAHMHVQACMKHSPCCARPAMAEVASRLMLPDKPRRHAARPACPGLRLHRSAMGIRDTLHGLSFSEDSISSAVSCVQLADRANGEVAGSMID